MTVDMTTLGSLYVQRIVLTGPTNAGKGTIARILSNEILYRSVRRYDAVREYAKEIGISNPTWRQLWDLDQRLMEKDPLDVINKIMQNSGSDHIIIDGSRHPHEILYLKADTTPTLVIAIDVCEDRMLSKDVRWKRLVTRGREDDPKNTEEFDQNDDIEFGRIPYYEFVNVAEAMLFADHLFYNNGTEDELGKAIKKGIIGKYQF